MLPGAYGYVQSKERYADQAELVVWCASTGRGIRWTVWCRLADLACLACGAELRSTRFPDLRIDASARAERQMDTPFGPYASSNQIEMREQGFLLGNQSTYNAFDPQARALYWKQANEGLFQYGVDAWWCDCTEPFEEDWRGQIKPEPWKRVTVNTDAAKQYLDPEYINAYSLFHSQMIYEGQRSVTEESVVNDAATAGPATLRHDCLSGASRDVGYAASRSLRA